MGPQGPRPQALTIRGDPRGKAMLPATRSSLLFGAGPRDLGSWPGRVTRTVPRGR